MTRRHKRPKRRRTVTLAYRDVERITYDMGWEPIDADAFWLLALERRKAGAP